MIQRGNLLLVAAAWLGIGGVTAAAEPSTSAATLDALQEAAQIYRDPRTKAITKLTFRRNQSVDTPIVDAVLSLPGLKSLDVSFTRSGAKGYDWIGQIESLESLAMNGLNVTDEDLAFVTNLPNLARLEIRQNRLSEASLRKLAAMPSIRELDVSDGFLQEQQLRQVEDGEPQLTFIRHWKIELVEDRNRLRMNTPVADFLFEAWAAYDDFHHTYTIPVSGPGKYRNRFFAGLKRDSLYQVNTNPKKGDFTVTTFFGGEFRLTGDGTQLVFKDATFDLTGANQTVFVSADEQGEFNQYRVENVRVLPNYVNGECFNSANGPHFILHKDAEQLAPEDLEPEEPYDGYRDESKGLGFCSFYDQDFKGDFAFILCEWPDEVATLEAPSHPCPAVPLKPTGRGVTIVYEGVPHSGRSSKEIAECPVGARTSSSMVLSLGHSRNLAWHSASLGLWHSGIFRSRSNAHFPLLELTYENGVCRIKHTQQYLDLEFLNRGRTLRCTQSYDPNKLLLPYEANDPDKLRESIRNREGRLLLEQEVSPTTDRPLYIIDRDGNFRLAAESQD